MNEPSDSQATVVGPELQSKANPPGNSIVASVKSLFKRAGRHKATCQCGQGECGRRMRAANRTGKSKPVAESNQFAAPVMPEKRIPVDFGQAGALEIDSPAGPVAVAEDWTAWGKAGASLIRGIYSLRNMVFRRAAEKKLPSATVAELFDPLEVPAEIISDLEAGYAEVAKELGAPAKYGPFARLAAAHINLELHYQKSIGAIQAALARLPDLERVA